MRPTLAQVGAYLAKMQAAERVFEAAADSDVRARLAVDPLATWRVSQALTAHLRAANPGFPSAESERADFEHHLRLKELLDRASAALARR